MSLVTSTTAFDGFRMQTLTTKVLIIGAGTGGYVAGIRCGQMGLANTPHAPLIPANAGTQCFG
jgi:pyruvate/2-oxoglutarate dehydrogenase complex dihydrolipoamide dehydrogenase (E3) component